MSGNSSVNDSCIYGPDDRAPSSSQVIQEISDLGAGAIIYMIVPVLLFVIMTAIYTEEAIFVIKHTDYWKRTQHRLWILSGFPVISGFCVIGLFFPRSSPTIQILISFYNAICMKKYFDLVLHYYGGKKRMAEITNEIKIKPNPFPCFMWCCLPNFRMTVRNIKIMQYLIYPVTVYQPIVFFILTVLWNEDLEGTKLDPLLTVLNLSVPLASFVAVYGFVIINKASEGPLRDYKIRGKFVSVQLILGINTVQMVIMLLLDRFRAVECGFPYQNPRPAFMIHLYIFPMELFLLSLMARYFFRFSEKGLKPIPEPRDESSDMQITGGQDSVFSLPITDDGSNDSGCFPGRGPFSSMRSSKLYSPTDNSYEQKVSEVQLRSYQSNSKNSPHNDEARV